MTAGDARSGPDGDAAVAGVGGGAARVGERADVTLAAAPAPPAGLGDLVGAAVVDPLRRYADWLAGAGTVRGLLGPREVPRLWERHLLNSAVVAPLLPPDVTVTDVGTGAGLPGLVLAIVRPDVSVVLVDATARRTAFLAEVVADLGLAPRVRVVTGRVEDRAVQAAAGSVDVVVSRAVAALPQLVRWCLPLLGDGGTMLAMKGSGARDEVAAGREQIRRAGAVVTGVHELGQSGQPTMVVAIRRRADVSRETRGER